MCICANNESATNSNVQNIAFYVHCCCLGSIASACGVKLGAQVNAPASMWSACIFLLSFLQEMSRRETVCCCLLLVFVDRLHVNMQVGVAYLFTFRHVKSRCHVHLGRK